jgi:hypothetical protein
MDNQQRKAIIEAGENAIQRQKSIQPRMTGSGNDQEMFTSVYNWVMDCDAPPPYSKDSRKRDSWLREFWQGESYLAGILNSTVLIDANRGWTLTGGRNQVNRYIQVCHNFENGKGWRHYQRKSSLAFRTADIGSVSEIGREGKNGPMRTLWNIDPTRCRFTGGTQTTMRYYPGNNAKSIPLRDQDYLSVISMPSTDETYNDLGYCGVSRAIELATTMIAIYQHDHEQLGARAPRGLLLLKNVTETMWENAMAAREEKLDGMERKYYGGVAVLASPMAEDIDAKLIALSNLPRDFDRKVFTDLYMYGLALIFGFDASEFWPVSGGVIGRGTETELQHEKATTKGVDDYPSTWREKFQGQLPETVLFEFDRRDETGDLQAAEVKQAQADVITSMYEAGLQQGVPLIDRAEARQLLSEAGLIPNEWTAVEEDITADDTDAHDTEQLKADLWRNPYVQRSLFKRPNEAIVRYHWDGMKHDLQTIYRDVNDYQHYATRKRKRTQAPVIRQDGDVILYTDGVVTITEGDVDRALATGAKNIGADWYQAVSSDPMTPEEIAENPVDE